MEVLLTFLIGLPVGIFISTVFHNPVSSDDKFWENSYFLIYLGLGIVPGWKTLNRITPQMFLFMSFMGWAFYFLIKGFSSLFVGLVSLPLMMIRNTLTLFK